MLFFPNVFIAVHLEKRKGLMNLIDPSSSTHPPILIGIIVRATPFPWFTLTFMFTSSQGQNDRLYYVFSAYYSAILMKPSPFASLSASSFPPSSTIPFSIQGRLIYVIIDIILHQQQQTSFDGWWWLASYSFISLKNALLSSHHPVSRNGVCLSLTNTHKKWKELQKLIVLHPFHVLSLSSPLFTKQATLYDCKHFELAAFSPRLISFHLPLFILFQAFWHFSPVRTQWTVVSKSSNLAIIWLFPLFVFSTISFWKVYALRTFVSNNGSPRGCAATFRSLRAISHQWILESFPVKISIHSFPVSPSEHPHFHLLLPHPKLVLLPKVISFFAWVCHPKIGRWLRTQTLTS